MNKKELIVLMRELKENQAKIDLKKLELKQKENRLNQITKKDIDISMTPSYEMNGDIQSKGSISDKVGNFIANNFDKTEKQRKRLLKEIEDIKKDIAILLKKTEEIEIRLNGLYYREREIVTAHYVEDRTYEDIAYNLYLELFGRTCTERHIRRIINESLEKMIKF